MVSKSGSLAWALAALLLFSSAACGQTDKSEFSLADAVKMALEHSYAVKAGQHDSLAAVQQEAAARALQFPALSLQAVAYRVDDAQTVDLPIGSFRIGAESNYQADLKLKLPIYTGGRISNNIKLKQEQLLAAAYGLEADRLKVAYNCRRAYLGALLSEYLLGSAQASLDRIGVISRDVSNLYSAGLADSLDLLEVESARIKGLDYVDKSEKARANSQAALAQLLGIPTDQVLAPSDSVPLPDLRGQTYFDRAAGGIGRPELQQLQQQINATGLQASLLSAEQIPSLSGYVGYTGGKPNRDLFGDTWNDYLTVGALLTWDFNLAGSKMKEARAVHQLRSSLEMNRKALEEALTLQANTTANDGRYAFRALQRAHNEYQVAQRKYRLAQEKQRAGELTVNRLLEQETQLTQAELMFQAAKVSYYLAITEYMYAIGSQDIYGGF